MQSKIWQKITEGSVVVVLLSIVSYFLYMDNKSYQVSINKRLDRLELQVESCNHENINLLKNELSKSTQAISQNTRILEKLLKHEN